MSAKKVFAVLLLTAQLLIGIAWSDNSAPVPLLQKDQPVDWWFVFKFNGATHPGCDGERSCPFGGSVQDYKGKFGQQYAYASSKNPSLQKGTGCLGDTLSDPVGATFDQVFSDSCYYVLWNDQFYGDPMKSANSPWGHSKGMVAWNDEGEGFVMQVSTPSWPASGNKAFPRTDGNTLGCVKNNNVKFSQHFFALRLNKTDLLKVLAALSNASIVTKPTKRELVRNGGPSEVQEIVNRLGQKSKSTTRIRVSLSTGIDLISKPSGLTVPPWQMVSASLHGVPLRTATWWANPKIASTTDATPIGCWRADLGTPGSVTIAVTGQWDTTTIGLTGGPQPNANHAKVGVSEDPAHPYVIFGDLNQQGALSDNCASSQNGRGGMFFILSEKMLFESVAALLNGETTTARVP